MTTIEYVLNIVIPGAGELLPAKMTTPAHVMLLAIGLQESRFEYRRQIRGPARGFWQFEAGGGVRGVLTHPASQPLIRDILDAMAYDDDVDELHEALADNDILACVFARLLLWTHPKPIPTRSDAAWQYYLNLWRPGKPHPETWDDFFEQAKGHIA